MKKNYIILALATLALASCKKVLDKQDLGSFTADQVYNDSTTTTLAVNYLYSQNQPAWFSNVGGLSGSVNSLSDEQYGDNVFVKGTATFENVTDIYSSNINSSNYGKIRVINMFIRDVNNGTMVPAMKSRFVSQALFWRAFRYFELAKLYGGVPLVLSPLEAVGQEAKEAALLPRAKTSEVFAQIVKDLDTCIKYLPNKWPSNSDYGRITKGAAMAYKGRVLLHWASPQFNPNNDATRWQAAYDANNLAVQNLTANGFGLYSKWDYTMWTTEGSNGGSTPRNPEAVLVTQYNAAQTDIGQNNTTYPNATVPKYLSSSGGGANLPTWDIAQAFPMKDGKDVGDATSAYAYNLATFYKNRDPRFYQTIAYNGCNWPVLANPNYRLWTYLYTNSKNQPASTETQATASGLYLRKGIDPNLTLATIAFAPTDWIEIRYAEVLLNLAECAAEVGQSQVAYDQLVAIRKRAGIDAGTGNLYGLASGLSGANLVNAVMHERQIELAFEGKRFWDLRRRKLLKSTFATNKRRMGVVVTLKNTNTGTDYILNSRDASANTNLDALYTASFTVTTKQLDTYDINYQEPGVYFFGIPTGALQNNINLKQTNTWGGPFDPLQ